MENESSCKAVFLSLFCNLVCGALPHAPQGSDAPLTPVLAVFAMFFNTRILPLERLAEMDFFSVRNRCARRHGGFAHDFEKEKG